MYGQKEFQDAQAVLRYSGHPRGADDIDTARPEAKRLHKVIKDRMRDIYRYHSLSIPRISSSPFPSPSPQSYIYDLIRFTWNLPGTATVLAQCSNLMIWSDNDIYNDFTIAKEVCYRKRRREMWREREQGEKEMGWGEYVKRQKLNLGG